MNNFTIQLNKDELLTLIATVSAQLKSMESLNNTDNNTALKAEENFLSILDNLGRRLTALILENFYSIEDKQPHD